MEDGLRVVFFLCIFGVMKRFLLLFASALMLISCATDSRALKKVSPASVGMDAERLSLIDSEVSRSIADGEIPGAVVAVVRGDKLAFLKAYGNRQVVPEVVPMTEETVFDLASVSKCVGTTLAFLQLVEQGKVRLTDEVRKFIPEFEPWADPETGRKVHIRIIDLMTHSSGLSPYINVSSYIDQYGAATPDSLMKHISTEIKRNFKPTTGYMYSCLNYITLQNILQRVTGERLCDYVQEHVFDVLGLEHTCYNPKEHPSILPLVAPTEVQEDGQPLLGEVHDPTARLVNCGNSGNAGVFSNAEDLAVIAAAIMNGGAIGKARILSPATVKTMCTVPECNDPGIGRALGWDNRSTAATLRGDLFSRSETICHTGYTGTSMVIDMESRTAVIILAHRVHPVDKGSVANLRARIANIVASAIVTP